MSTFDTTQVLPNTGCTEEDFYNLVRTLKPLAALVDTDGLQILSDKIALAVGVPRWVKYTKTYSDLSAAALTNNIELFQLPAGGIIHAIKLKHSVPFTGGAISAYTASVGISGNLTKYLNAFDVRQATGETVYRTAFAPFFDTLNTLFGTVLSTPTSVNGELASASTTVDGAIAALVMSGPSTVQVNALRDATEVVADDLRTLATRSEKLGDDVRLLVTELAARLALIPTTTPGAESHTAATSIRLAATSVTANLSVATAGSVDVWVMQSTTE